MKSIIEKTIVALMLVCATGGAWAVNESALIVNVADTSVTIANYSSSSRLDQSNIGASDAKICIASGLDPDLVASGMRVRVDNFEFVRDYNGTTPAPSKIRIVVDGVAHTSDTRTETSLSLKHQNTDSKPISYGCKYVFPSTPYLKVGESYDVKFLDSNGNTQSTIRYEVVSNSAELITGISSGDWRAAYTMSGTIIATVSKANNDTISSADAGGLIVVNGGTVNVSGSATATGLIISSNTTLHFEEGATLTLSGPLYVESGNTLAISSADTISGSQTFITAGSVCATAGAIVSSDASYSASATSATVALTSYSNEASVSGEVNWSSIVWNDGTWHNGSPATLTLTDDATINFDNTYSMSSLTLTGAHAVTLVYTKTPTISSGISCENSATCKIKIPATSTDWPIASEWAVPNDGITYILVGSSDSSSLTTCAGKITVNGKLETTGYLNLSAENKIAATGELKVLDGRTKMNTGENGGGICGTLTIESGAVFENARGGDGLNYSGSPTVDVYGTLDMASTRWTINSANTLNFHAGSTVTGTGQNSYGALDSNQTVTYNIRAKDGQDTVNLSAKLRLRSQQTFDIAAGVTVNCTGTVGDKQNQINITGNGKFKIATGASFPASVSFNVTSPATLELAGGTIADAIKGTGNLSVASGTYEPSFSSFSGAVSVSGSGVLTLTPAQVTAVSGITVGSGSTLKIKVTTDEINHGFDASAKVSNSSGTVMFVDSSGTQITENVSGDGETLNPAAKIWGDSASGTWDTAANWTVGVAPSDGDTVLLETADATITISTSSAAGAVSVNESTTIAGTAAALQSFATKVTSITVASGKTLTLSCTDDGAYEFNRSIGGAGALAVSRGTVTFKQENTFTGGLTVKQGGTLVKGDGVKRFGPDGRSITVEVGGTLDLNKTSVDKIGVSYAITIVEGDSSVWETTPVLTNTGDSLGTGWKQTSSITVRANATIECNSNHNWGLLASGYGTSSLKIGKGKTLRKVGGGEFWLTNVMLSNLDGDSGSGDAVLKIVAGSATVVNNGTDVNALSSGALFKVEVVGGSLEVNKNFTISALSHQGGSVNIAADKTLTVPSINVAANATMAPAGTIACNGDMTIGGTVTVPADKTWCFGSSDNDTSVNAGRISVVSGGTLVINGRVENRNRYGSAFNGLSIEEGGTVQVGATGTLADLDHPGYTWYNINCQTMVAGNLVIDGTWHNYGIVTVAATGKLSVADTRNVQNVNSEILNYGQVEMIRWGYLTYAGSFIRNYDSGAVVYAPDDDNVGQSIGPVTQYVSFAQGTSATVLFDVSNLTSLPSGTSALTLLTTSTSLTLTADSVIGCSADYYVKQDGTTGAVTLQLHAAKDSAGVYYDDIEDAFEAIVEDHTLSVTILDGTEANYATELAENGLFVSGTQVSFLAAEVKDGMGVLDPVPYASVADAINAAKNSMKYVVAYESITMSADFSSVYIECAGGVSITLNHASDEYQYSSTLAVGSIYQYTATPKAADYTWNGETDNWGTPSNWLFAGNEAARYPRIAGDTATFNDDASLELGTAISIGQLNVGSATVSFTAAGSAIESGESVNFTTANGIVLTDAAATLSVRNVNLSTTPTTSVEGKYVKSVIAGDWTTYTVADHKATVYDSGDAEVQKYDTVADAVSAATDGQKVTLFANSNEAITLNGKSITFNEGSYTFSGTFTGNGTLVLTALLKSAATARWAAGWTGTVVLPTPLDSINASGNNVIFFNRYGITGSTVKVGSINAGWLQIEEAINPTIEIESNFTLTAFSSQGRPYTFKAFKGSGEFSVSCPAASVADYASWGSDHSAYYLVKDVSNFTGSMTVSNCGIAIGDSKPDYRTPGGKIIVNSGKSATVAAGKTWTATNLKIDGEVSISNASAFSGTVEGNGRIVCTATLGSALTYGSWTGTVVLPYINGTDGGFYFNRYGKAGSTVEIANDFTGWLNTSSEDTRIAKANVVVNAGKTFTISGSNSSTAYGLTKLSGAGNFAFRQTNAPGSFTISTLEDFTGTISNSIGSGTPTAITITKVKLASAPTPGLRLVNTDTPNYVNVSGVYVGEVAQAVNLIKKSDGIYVAATSSVEGSGAAAVTTIATSSSDSQVEVSVNVGDDYTGTIIVPANVTKLATTGTAVADGKLKLKVNYGVDSTAIYENILTRDASGYISLTSDADAAVGGVKVTPEIKTGDAENPPMAMSGSAPAFSAKAIPGLWYAVKAASSVADLGDKFKYGTPVQATGDTVNIEAPTFPGTVTYYRLSAGMNQDDVTRYIVSTNRLAVRPTTDGLFAYGENSTTTTAAHDCYRIPAIASTWLPGDAGDPLQAIVMGIYDARTSYWDLGQRMSKTTNERQWNNNEHHFAGIDIAGNYSLDGGASWSAAQIMIDVPNAFDPATGEDNIDSTSGIDKAYDIGDPAIVYVPATEKFLMMGITGGGNSSVSNVTANAMGADLVMYECTASSVANGAPVWQKVTGFTKEGVIALLKAKDDTLTFDYPPNGYSFDYDSTRAWTRETVYFLSILQGPGNALVTRKDCESIKAGTIVFPMQYCAKKRTTDGNHVGISYTFALYSTDNGATWNVTSVCKDAAAYGSECCIAQLDDGSLLMEVRPPNASTKRAFFRSTDFNTWTKACELVESAGPAEGSILRIGAKDGKSVYACSFTTGATRADLQLFIGTDYTSDEDVANVAKGINWTATPFCTIWKGDTGTASTGSGVDTVVYGYSSLVMLDETTLGVLLEAHGHIYFTKIDVSSALK